MTAIVGFRRQADQFDLYTFSGTIAVGGTAQVLLPQQPTRCYLQIQNTSAALLTVGIGPATCTPTLSGGKITAVAVANGGLGYVVAPQVVFLGGLAPVNAGLVASDFNMDPTRIKQSSFRPAQAVATIAAGVVTAITVTDQGNGYLSLPYVYLYNPPPDLGGGAITPSATVGLQLAGATAPAAGGSVTYENSVVPTGAVNIFGGTGAQAFEVKVGF